MLRSFTGNTPFTTDSKGYTLLHYAACNGHRLSVQMVREGETARQRERKTEREREREGEGEGL